MESSPDIFTEYIDCNIRHDENDNTSSASDFQASQPLLESSSVSSSAREITTPPNYCAVNMPLDRDNPGQYSRAIPVDNTSYDSGSQIQNQNTHLENCSTIENPHDDNCNSASLHDDSNIIDETPETPKPPFDWNRSIWDNTSISNLSKPWVTLFIGLLFLMVYFYDYIRAKTYDKPSIKGVYQLDWSKLNRAFKSRKFDITLISFHFVHLDLEHLLKNVFLMTISGAFVECITGNFPFLLIFSSLCYSIPIEWYNTKLDENLSEKADSVVGASGVILAHFPIVAILLFCIIILVISVKFMTAENRKIKLGSSKFWLLTVSASFCIGFTIVIIIQYIIDTEHPETKVANDIHLLGLKQGAIAGPIIGICYILRTVFWPIIRLKFENQFLDFVVGFKMSEQTNG